MPRADVQHLLKHLFGLMLFMNQRSARIIIVSQERDCQITDLRLASSSFCR